MKLNPTEGDSEPSKEGTLSTNEDKIPRVMAIVVNWNGGEMVNRAINSLYQEDYPALEVIVVDNGSHDGSQETIRRLFPDAILIQNKRNLGFARANNQGFEEGFKREGDLFFLLNNDAFLEKGALWALVKFLSEHPRVGAVSPLILFAQDKEKIWYKGGMVKLVFGWVAHRGIRQPISRIPRDPIPTEYLTGCALLIRGEALRQAGPFNTQFDIYGEDVDFSLRLRKLGWELWVVPQGIIYHQVSASSGGAVTPWKIFHRTRSTVLLMKRHLRWWEWLIAIPASAIINTLYSLMLILRGARNSLIPLWWGYLNGLIGQGVPQKYSLPT